MNLRTTHGQARLYLRFFYDFVIQPVEGERHAYAIVERAYEYSILDSPNTELLAYHWHPSNPGDVNLPHLHLSNRLNAVELGRQREPLRLADMHLVTGHVHFEDVVWLLLREFGVQPLVTDWQRLLDDNARLARAALDADPPPHIAS